jgi:hypothetical protein
MKNRFFPTLILLAVLLAACAPVAVTDAPSQVAAQPSATPLVDVATPTLAAATQAPVVEVSTALPLATSRGPDLHATDPSTVSLASGELHFVEFFRFT